MKILHLRKSHIDAIVTLNEEFNEYLGSLSSIPRDKFDAVKNKKNLLRYGFGKEKSFSGYVVKMDGEII
jgi:hypothetical protein